jgi:O-antigen ligase
VSEVADLARVNMLRRKYLKSWVMSILLIPTILDYFFMGSSAARFSRVLIVCVIVGSMMARRDIFFISKVNGGDTIFLVSVLFFIGSVSALNSGGVFTPNILLLLILLFFVGTNIDLYDDVLKSFALSSYVIIWFSTAVILLKLNPLGLYFDSTGYPVFLNFIGIPGRNYGIFTHPNSLGQAAAISLLFMVSFKVKKIYLFAPILCLIKCGSRTALLSVAGGLIIYSVVILFKTQKNFMKKKKMESPIVIGTFILLILSSSSLQFLQYINLLDSNALTGRASIWQSSLVLFKESSLFGLGWGWQSRAIKSQLINVWAVSSHNIILEIMFATGIIGLLIFLFFVAKTFTYFTSINTKEKLAIVSILISGFSESYIDLQYPTYYTFLFFVIVATSNRQVKVSHG